MNGLLISSYKITVDRRKMANKRCFFWIQKDNLKKRKMAEQTGLEPATPGVTGRYSNQLNYCSAKLATPCEVGAIILMHLGGVNIKSQKN